jgi:CRISPR-associated exonuclease Cas4
LIIPEVVQIDDKTPFRVTDLKQWTYCPRILYFELCLPGVRPTTYKMEAGTEAAKVEEGREVRRSLRAYGFQEGRREFNVEVVSSRLGLRGLVDMVIWVEGKQGGQVIPVDYKLSDIPGEHFKMQLAAYGLMLEEISGFKAPYGFIYSLTQKKAEKVRLDKRLREKTSRCLEAMQRMLWREAMPDPAASRARCTNCEFRRFCNDVV